MTGIGRTNIHHQKYHLSFTSLLHYPTSNPTPPAEHLNSLHNVPAICYVCFIRSYLLSEGRAVYAGKCFGRVLSQVSNPAIKTGLLTTRGQSLDRQVERSPVRRNQPRELTVTLFLGTAKGLISVTSIMFLQPFCLLAKLSYAFMLC